MTEPAADTSAVLTAQDSLVLASMQTPVEMQLVMDWLGQQRARNPDATFDVLKLPSRNAPPTALTALVEQLESGEDRSVVPVRVFWLPPAGSRQSRQGGRAAPGPGSLPPQPTSAAPHPAQRSPPRAGGGRRVGQGVRTPPAVARHHRRRERARFRAVRHTPRHLGDGTCRVPNPRTSVQVSAAGEARDLGVRAVSRRPAEDPGRNRRRGREDARRTRHRVEQGVRRPRFRPRQDAQPRIRSGDRLRRVSDRGDACRAGSASGGAAVLAPVLHRRRGGAGGDAGEPATAGACVRRYQPVVRVDGAAAAPLRGHLHPPQHRR